MHFYELKAQKPIGYSSVMILVTGATGNTGRSVVRALERANASVRPLVRAAESEPSAPAGAVVADYDDAAALEQAMSGVKRVFLVSPFGPKQIEQEKRIIDLATKANVEVVVKISSTTPEFRSRSVSAIHVNHAEIENHLRLSGLTWVMVRPNFFMQNLFGLLGQFKAEGRVSHPFNESRLGMIDAEDIAEVSAAALLDAKWWNRSLIVSGTPVTFRDVASELSRIAGREIPYLATSFEETRNKLRQANMPQAQIERFATECAYVQRGGLSVFSDHVEAVLGRPAKSLRQFFEENRARLAESL